MATMALEREQGRRRYMISASCWEERRECVAWVEKYLEDCVCDLKSKISFSLGIVSLAFWGVAEIPQILTNFRTKSGHGVSITLLFTWFIGDIFNLIGCRLEPATLPTQLYTAMLYTAVTAVLLLQTLYYDYFCRFQGGTTFKNAYNNILDEHIDDRIIEGKKQPLIDPKARERAKPVPTAGQHSSNRASPRTEFYFTSARSLASSGGTPSHQQLYSTYLGRVGSGPSAAAQLHDSTSDDEDSAQSHSYAHHRPSTKPKPIFSHSAGYATLIIGSVGLPSPTTALVGANAAQDYGRRLLQVTRLKTLEANPYGMVLGWVMAAIYMGGRLPQIYLNIKRGSVEGLNPFMFIFAITANATYVGSIFARSIEWKRIAANAPWLLDAIACVVLDLFIIMQFAYYNYLRKSKQTDNSDKDDGEGSTQGLKTNG